MRQPKRFSVLVIVAFCGFVSYEAIGQTACPIGVAAGSAQCGPGPVPSSDPIQAAPQGAPTVVWVPTGKWKNSYGAIVQDIDNASIGVSNGVASESIALREAVKSCKKGGGVNCKTILTYFNKCAAGASPEISGISYFMLEDSAEAASNIAMAKCKELNPDRKCFIGFSGCAVPTYIKY